MNKKIENEPKGFSELCEKIGLALLMGQKVQFSLAHFYATYQLVNSSWTEDRAKQKIQYHLSKPMGVVVADIEKDINLKPEFFDQIVKFKKERNWLAHDFDEESTPYISEGKRIDHYTNKMDEIVKHAMNVMLLLHVIGEDLIPVGI